MGGYMVDFNNVVEFCRDELGISDKVEIVVSLENLIEDNIHGWCTNSSDMGDFNKNEYDIELDKTLDDDEMLVTLCHEMVHVRQYSQGGNANEREAEELETVLAKKYKEVFLVV